MEGTQLGQYVILGKLGAGGMANVYIARHQRLGHVVALKILHTQYQQKEEIRVRFLDEARIQANLRHPNILTVQDIIELPDFSGMVMDFLVGGTLDALYRNVPDKRLNSGQFLTLFMPILDALHYAHDAGIVHRDLKPSNIFLQKMQHGVIPKLMDFGIAKLRTSALQSQVTVAGSMLGTPQYMAPEQFTDSSTVDARADIYALGASMFEALAGRYPYDAVQITEIMRAVLSGDVRKPSEFADIDPEIESVVMRCLALKREDRYASAAAVLQSLQTIASRIPPQPISPKDVPHEDLKRKGIDVNTPITAAGKNDVRSTNPPTAGETPSTAETSKELPPEAETDTDDDTVADSTPKTVSPKAGGSSKSTRYIVLGLVIVGLTLGTWAILSLTSSDPKTKTEKSQKTTQENVETPEKTPAQRNPIEQEHPIEPAVVKTLETIPGLALGVPCESPMNPQMTRTVNAILKAGWRGTTLRSTTPATTLDSLGTTSDLLHQFELQRSNDKVTKTLYSWAKKATAPTRGGEWDIAALKQLAADLAENKEMEPYIETKVRLLCETSPLTDRGMSQESSTLFEQILSESGLARDSFTRLDRIPDSNPWLNAEIHTRAICCLLSSQSIPLK